MEFLWIRDEVEAAHLMFIMNVDVMLKAEISNSLQLYLDITVSNYENYESVDLFLWYDSILYAYIVDQAVQISCINITW